MTIDDDRVHHKIVDVFIKRSGLVINHYPFQNGLDAFDYISNNNDKAYLPDIILLNLSIPSDWSFLEIFNQISPQLKKQIDVIILTSSTSTEEKDRAYSYTFVKGFFLKPFTQFLLKDILESNFLVNKVAPLVKV